MPATTTEVRVRYAETDQMGVAYHANYLIWCEIGRTDFIRQHGMNYAEMERNGVGLAVSDVTMRFHASATYDDRVRIETTLTDVRSRQIAFAYVLSNAETGAKLVSATTSLIAIDAAGRPRAMPADLRAALEATR
jgi:acyl-CoA thioester hydrolase